MEAVLKQHPPQLGRLLLQRNLITPLQWEKAIAEQQRCGEKMGRILVGMGAINPLALHEALADQQQLPFVNLMHDKAEKTLLRFEHAEEYIRLRAVPWRQDKYGRIIFAAAEITPELKSFTEKHYGYARVVMTSPNDILWTIESAFAQKLDAECRSRLWKSAPHYSARQTLHPFQQLAFLLLLQALCFSFLAKPYLSLVVLFTVVNCFYLLTIGFKCLLFLQGITKKINLPHIPDRDLPIYTILIPLYKEVAALPGLLQSIRSLDYPHAKLDVKLVVEKDDHITIEAAQQLKPEYLFEIIRVPYSLPRTKPKACNYALRFAKGEFVTIYDAEDRPDPQQLRKAVAMFRTSPAEVICLQSRLNYYNRDQNMLTRLFAIEYASWFDYMLPGLERHGIPIPLGGTSNHLSLQRLRELGEWDPYNVTEDADLGIRLAISGFSTRMLDSLTLEEAPSQYTAWMKQRTRWIKGYMQTWLVHMRSPVKLYRQFGHKGFWGFQLFVGGPSLVFLTSPFLWGISLCWMAGWFTLSQPFPHWLSYLCSTMLALGLIAHSWFGFAVIKDFGWKRMGIAVLIYPFYWILHSIASFRALFQLVLRPHYWDKTAHGFFTLSQQDTDKMRREMQYRREQSLTIPAGHG